MHSMAARGAAQAQAPRNGAPAAPQRSASSMHAARSRRRGAGVARATPPRHQAHQLPSTAAAAMAGDAAAVAGFARAQDDLLDPAQIGAQGQAATSVPDFGGDVSLETYMRLPIEQYFVLDPERITFLGGSRFALSVPRIHLLGTWIEPHVEVTVLQEPGAVVLQADRCFIRGSEAIENLRLNERFSMTFSTRLTWQGAAAAAAQQQQQAGSSDSAAAPGNSSHREAAAGSGEQAAAAAASPGGFSLGASLAKLRLGGGRPAAAAAPQGKLEGEAQVDVWCEVVPPFHLMPRATLQASCNAVLRGLVGSLLPLFVRQLAADYARWGVDAEYRESRAARSKPLEAPTAAP